MFFIDNTEIIEKIKIDDSWTYGCNRCIVCDNPFKHSRTWFGKDDGIYELREKIAHYSCDRMLRDIKKKKQELCELEYKLFEKKYLLDEKDREKII
jgi:hypothetical protein